MQDNFLIEVFSETDFEFISKAVAEEQKYEFDYLSIVTNTLTVLGHMAVHKRNYMQIRTRDKTIQAVVTGVEYTEKETKIKYKSLMALLDIDVYKKREDLSDISAEEFIGQMIEDNFVNNSDSLQNIAGLSVRYASRTIGAKLNLKDNIHNIYDLILTAFKKYGIVVSFELNVMKNTLICTIGIPAFKEQRIIEGDLANVLDIDIVIKEYDEAANKAIIIGEYPEDNVLYGQTLERVFYLDARTGQTTSTPEERVVPVVLKYKTITISEESFEDDAYNEAADMLYREENDNSIKISFARGDALHQIDNFAIGQSCMIIKNGISYKTIFTGWTWNKTITLQFGAMRTEYTKNMRRFR